MASPVPLRRVIYTGTFIHCLSLEQLEVLESVAVGVNEKGIIAFVERNVQNSGLERLVKEKHGWVEWDVVAGDQESTTFFFPGFVDTHIHASQFPNAGIFGKTTLLSWLHTYTFPLESSFSALPTASRIYSHCIARTLAHGTTTAAYFTTTHVPATNLLASRCLSLGQRAFIGRCNMDSHIHPDYYKDASPASALADTRATIEHIHSLDQGPDPSRKLVSPILTPRFVPSCTSALLSGLGALHKETNLPIQTHISENVPELALVASLFPDLPSYTAVYDAHALLTPRTVLAHAVHLSPAEIELIKTRGSGISHCPTSNAYLGSGICPVRELLDAGIPMGLGTDVSGGFSPSILHAAKEAGMASRLRTAFCPPEISDEAKERLKLGVEETLYLATRGGAGCLGLGERVGVFEVGKEWDVQLVDLGKTVDEDGEGGKGGVALWGTEGWEDRVAKWVVCGDDRNTRAVWVAGRLVSGDTG